jgi:hypothetical protein
MQLVQQLLDCHYSGYVQQCIHSQACMMHAVSKHLCIGSVRTATAATAAAVFVESPLRWNIQQQATYASQSCYGICLRSMRSITVLAC